MLKFEGHKDVKLKQIPFEVPTSKIETQPKHFYVFDQSPWLKKKMLHIHQEHHDSIHF